MEKKKMDKIIKSAITGVLSLTAAGALMASTQAMAAEKGQEKCYGIAKAGMNDCNTATSSCAGTSKTDGQADAYVLLPEGVCKKIVGGSLEAKTKS
ncbi:BufA1 family periplasmic bufferin-type metallophore [Legionella oakridgensis]|uniref:Signal peptide protein n=1 Tax=Legionella oakridgensis TaxID=29423 RepID=A0A0W0WY06_9GAMM|nr:DUF2282 domain-containing protein [Legionella oakridgensis]ETO93337.1 putative integral membrane protein [Legionella oakridgensis RV-2-2007]KTD37202.1 signal peptide protein [Legionella oakridgensis]STY20146.1 signal peptide protein [Legionella longbeachae]